MFKIPFNYFNKLRIVSFVNNANFKHLGANNTSMKNSLEIWKLNL